MRGPRTTAWIRTTALAAAFLALPPALAAAGMEEALRALPPRVAVLALERIALEHEDPKVFRAFSRLRDEAPALLVDADLHALAKVAFLSRRRTYARITRRDVHRAQVRMQKAGHGALLENVPVRAAFLYLTRDEEVIGRLVRDLDEVLEVETTRQSIRLAQRCLLGMRGMNLALERWQTAGDPLPEGGVPAILARARAEPDPPHELSVAQETCPLDDAAYLLESVDDRLRVACRNHEPPKRVIPMAPPPPLSALAETNTVAWARLQAVRPAPAAPRPGDL